MAAFADPRLRAVLMGFTVLGALGWFFFAILFAGTPGQDFMVFHTAAHVMARGDIGLLLDAGRFTAELNATHKDWLKAPLDFHPWVYPPPMLLLAMPFGFLPYGIAYALFIGGTMAAMFWALRRWAPPGQARHVLCLGTLLCPAMAYAIGAGQNSFLNAFLCLFGFLLLGKKPFAAGMVLGVLGLKPQLALMVPVALLAQRNWRAILGAISTGVLLCIASLAFGGIALWRAWLTLMLSGDSAFHTWIDLGRLYGQSVYADLRVLGFTHAIASNGQYLAALCSAYAVWRVFSKNQPKEIQLAVFLVASLLAAPHVSPYDAVFAGIAAMLVLMRGTTENIAPWSFAAAIAVWVTTLLNPARLWQMAHLPMPGVLTPLIFLLFFWAVRDVSGGQAVA
jgi:hypothetical protein